jgi:type 1 glutamine amidotransferase
MGRRGESKRAGILAASVAAACLASAQGLAGDPTTGARRLLAVGASADWHHESVSDALVALYELGRDSGLWETTIRTDVLFLTKREPERNAKNLDHFDAVFFMTGGELPLDAEQKQALLSFVKDDGKGFLGAHSATATFAEWPAYVEMVGGTFDGHPWDQVEAVVKIEDPEFPAMRHFPRRLRLFDEFYQIAEFSRERSRVLMSLDTTSVDMKREAVRQQDVPVAWVHSYGRGRVFYCSLGHPPAVWAREDVRRMWLEAVKWAMGL